MEILAEELLKGLNIGLPQKITKYALLPIYKKKQKLSELGVTFLL